MQQVDTAALAARFGTPLYVYSADAIRERLAQRAAGAGKRVRFALRLNPDVDAGTHAYVTTGLKRNKFGMPFALALAALRDVAGRRELEFRGFHVHIGSQVADPTRFREAAKIVAGRVEQARTEGFEVSLLDFGGGFAATYETSPPPIEQVAEAVIPLLAPLKVDVVLEPGRYLVAEAGILLTRVIAVKPADPKAFVIVDAAMNDLLRPALYGAHHPIELVAADAEQRPLAIVDVVGPVCETGDFLAQDRELRSPNAGELLAVRSAGAYGMSMASNYNTRPRAAEVLVDGRTIRLIRRRETLDDLLAPET